MTPQGEQKSLATHQKDRKVPDKCRKTWKKHGKHHVNSETNAKIMEMCVSVCIYIYVCMHIYIYTWIFTQHFFLLIAVFAWIYACSDFLCSLELENAHLFLDGRAFTLFSRLFMLISRENTLIISASKCTKCKTATKWCNYAHVEKNRSKSRNLSNEDLFVFFRGCRYTRIEGSKMKLFHEYLWTIQMRINSFLKLRNKIFQGLPKLNKMEYINIMMTGSFDEF